MSTKAYENGLSRDQLDQLVDIITLPNELDQASIGTIIRNLYPNTKVSDDSVVKVVGSLGHGQAKASFAAQAALIKWLVMVHDVLGNPQILSQLYGFLFNLLDTIAIRYYGPGQCMRLADYAKSASMPSSVAHHTSTACQTVPNTDAVTFPNLLLPT